ncbi:MAG: hypothetical protein GEU98_26670 [Pseudonocardiaceae bacterium]|nr:hypothetical protein [Pseudonocardiaceae bacterium]
MELYRDNPRATSWLRQQATRFDDPLRLAVIGPSAAGKSTLVNALVGDGVAPIEPSGTQVMCFYRGAQEPRAIGYPAAAPPRELPAGRSARRLRIDLDGLAGEGIGRLEVGWPSRSLRELVLIDTPAVGPDSEPRAVRSVCADADAVLCLLRQPYGTDLDVLRAVHEHPAMRAPVNALVVLSRADELGAGRVDGLISARQIARRRRREADVHEVCQDVVAVAGLAASGGRTLGEPEFTALAMLARLPKEELDTQLLSAQRFGRGDSPLPVDAATREGLLGRFGLFGIRLATTLIRRGADSQPALAAQLVQRSGLGELRESIDQYFVAPAEVLKARSALVAVDVLLRMEPRPGTAALSAELDRALAGAHELQELRLLATLQAERDLLPEDWREDAERLIGAYGTGLPERLGLHQPSGAEIYQAVHDALWRWRAQVENPALGVAARRAAMTVLRSCEAMAVGGGDPRPAYF